MVCFYPSPTNATVGIPGLINYINTAAETCYPVIGGNLVGMLLLIPAWFIIFLILTKTAGARAGFTTASFVCSLLSLGLVVMSQLNPYVFGLFVVLTIAGAAAIFLGGSD
jgi:hypothetical protein